MGSLFPDETNEHKLSPPFAEGGSVSTENDAKILAEGHKPAIDDGAHGN
jgi:hypothetical protein